MTKVKICGVTLPDDAAAVSAAGADFIGFNFWSKSKRYLEPNRAPILAAAARGAGNAQIVGVFVDAPPKTIAELMQVIDLDVIQLHGSEAPDDLAEIETLTKRPIWKAIAADRTQTIDRYTCDAILLDTPTPQRGGSGTTFDWSIARDVCVRYPARLVVLAGGLTPENVAGAVATVGPWAIDVASGVETAPGIKDATKVRALIAAVRGGY